MLSDAKAILDMQFLFAFNGRKGNAIFQNIKDNGFQNVNVMGDMVNADFIFALVYA